MPKKTPGTDSRFLFVLRLLRREKVQYVVVGSVASNLHGHVRATKDIDLLVPKDRENMRKLLKALSGLPYGMAREWDADELLERVITIIGDDPRVDILTAAGSLNYREARKNCVIRKIRGVSVVYASLPDLIRSKRTDRLQDKADIEALRALSGEE